MTTRKQKRRPPPPTSYRERTYRRAVSAGALTAFEVRVRETDLQILASADLSEAATNLVFQYRGQLENYIATHPAFLSSLAPLPVDPLAPPIVKAMQRAAEPAGVGPMAAVAGAVAEFVGRDLIAHHGGEVVVENGGDIYLHRAEDCVVGIFAGTSPLSNRVGIRLAAERMPIGVCTSSGRIGHSLSLGKADAVTAVAASTLLADAAATRLGNEVKQGSDIERALAIARTIPGLAGAVIIHQDRLGAWGEVELVRLT